MKLKLMYITNEPIIAKIAENSGIDWIFIDLEIIGKFERQGHLDTVISRHSIENILEIKKVLKKSKLLVRINPIYDGSREEINKVIEYGADIIMLPYFKDVVEVESFLELVNSRVEICLLLETPEAVNCLDKILLFDNIDYIHIGLNDLHLGYKLDFMFELLSNGVVEEIIHKISKKNIPYGIGGISKIGTGDLPAEVIIAEHKRLNSSMVILSRNFYRRNDNDDIRKIEQIFNQGVYEIRDYENLLNSKDALFFDNNLVKLSKIVEKIVKRGRE